MPVNSNNVFVGAPDQSVTGAILTGPETDVIPDTINEFVFDGLDESGYIDENGVTITPTESTTNLKDWSLRVIRKILTEFDSTINWAHLELSEEALKNYMGDNNVTVTAATESTGSLTKAAIAGEMRPRKAWYFKIKDGVRRALVFVPHGQVTDRGEIALLAGDAVKLPVTLTTYPDAAGKNIYIFLDDGVVSAAVTKTGWQVTITGTPDGGTWSLSVNGFATAPLAHSANSTAIANALNALSGITGISGITASGASPTSITFPVPVALTADGSELTGGDDPDVTVV